MELKEILDELSVFGNDLPLPREALAEAVRQKEVITPILLESLDTIYEKVRSEGEGVCDDPVYDLSFYALYLLAEFQEQKAFPKLLQILQLDSESVDLLLGDCLTDGMGNILYSTYNGDIATAKAIVTDSSLNPFVREAPLNLMEGLFRDGRLPREELIEFLRERLSLLGGGEDEEIFGGMLVSLIASNDLYELAEDVREAYRLEKIDLMRMGEFDHFFDYLHNADQHYQYTRMITDAAKELSGWACFKEEQGGGPPKPSISDILSWNVGRNAPCPCGSGKKFKKCCLPKQEKLQLSARSMQEIDRDRYPPMERKGDRPGLSDFYNRDAIAVDRLAYQAFLLLDHPTAEQKKRAWRTRAEAQKLLWEAFEKFQQICEAKGLKTAEEFDREHKVHYYSGKWLEVLYDLLNASGDDRRLAVKAVLSASQ